MLVLATKLLGLLRLPVLSVLPPPAAEGEGK